MLVGYMLCMVIGLKISCHMFSQRDWKPIIFTCPHTFFARLSWAGRSIYLTLWLATLFSCDYYFWSIIVFIVRSTSENRWLCYGCFRNTNRTDFSRWNVTLMKVNWSPLPCIFSPLAAGVDMARLFNHVLLQQTQPEDSQGAITITNMYSTWLVVIWSLIVKARVEFLSIRALNEISVFSLLRD